MNQSAKPHNYSRQALLKLMRKVYQEKYHEACPLPPCCFNGTTLSTRPPAWVWPISSASSLERKPPVLKETAGSPGWAPLFTPVGKQDFSGASWPWLRRPV